ncbi:hypothetical protein EWH08_09205 [Sphingobium indicum]|uniref:Transposase n=2 Tax=Sphingobium indicum TaxID=332055 RepID=A0A1L5BST8_SPHIB|nr:hypothetical protein SIDU_16250 [Sphingobium indicum B90A]NYI22642.1 hypothetical protein [Sphingobium indicum]RYM02381.1 hypothetical protein EWH08_09205 [Sphingobium indicum]
MPERNARLRAELGSMKDRLAVVERIVTDESHALNREIERLRGPANWRAPRSAREKSHESV